ncbi:MAG: CRISPR-associated endonuclease Cas2 [Nitrospirae bacterium]|nr:MAG: CRISPR-associated endonuclease Cas2 [Nitrospirota bacterium]
MKNHYLVCYDITEPSRLQRVYNRMKSWGLHIQYSVFFCTLTRHQLSSLIDELNRIIDTEQDDIRIYPLPSNPETIVLGCGDRVPDGVEVIV